MVSSQKFVPVDDIQNDLVFLKDGSVGLIIVTSAVNFGLLFETEQMAIIEAFAGLLNSLSFPIQIVVYSKRMDVSSYLKVLDEATAGQVNPLLKQITISYRRFVESMIKEKNVLDKQFYVCLNVTSLELGMGFKNRESKAKKALTELIPRRDHLLRQLNRLGLKAHQLSTVELVKLFYDWYNPAVATEVESAQPVPVPPTPAPSTLQTPPPQPVQFTPPQNTQIRMQSASPPVPPPVRTNTPFVVEELSDE